MTPIDSKRLGIGFIRNMSTIGFEVAEFQKKDLKRKICTFPWKNDLLFFQCCTKLKTFNENHKVRLTLGAHTFLSHNIYTGGVSSEYLKWF